MAAIAAGAVGQGSTRDGRVVVLGATGYTGRLVVAELRRAGQPCAIAGRDLTRLDKLVRELNLPEDTPRSVADPVDSRTLKALTGPDSRVILNCAGPFTRLGEPVVRAAVEAGRHYLDISGEQAYLARILDKYDRPAHLAGCAVVPACGFEYALTNWAVALALKGLEPAREAWTATALQGVRTSRGTRLSLFEALSQPGIGWQQGRRTLRTAGSKSRRVAFPPPFGTRPVFWTPFGEMVTVPRHLQLENLDSYLALPPLLGRSLRWLGPLLPVVSQAGGRLFGPGIGNPPPGYQERSEWAIVARAQGSAGWRQVNLQGRNVYELTAVITAWCAARLLRPDFLKTGALGPAQAFDPRSALEYLKQTAGLKIEISEG